MLAFAAAGAGGIAQTTFQLNAVVHNTMWIVGHFHLTLGMSVAMTFFGLSYWLIPYLSGRVLTPAINKLGIVPDGHLDSGDDHDGLLDAYLRAPRIPAPNGIHHLWRSCGGSRLGAVHVGNRDGSAAAGCRRGDRKSSRSSICCSLRPKGRTEFPVAEKEPGDVSGYWTERWGIWAVLMIIVVAMAYVVPLVDMIVNAPPGSPPYRTW